MACLTSVLKDYAGRDCPYDLPCPPLCPYLPRGAAKGNTPHWHLIELGNEVAKPQPFLVPAAQATAEQAINLFGTELDKQITKIVSKLR